MSTPLDLRLAAIETQTLATNAAGLAFELMDAAGKASHALDNIGPAQTADARKAIERIEAALAHIKAALPAEKECDFCGAPASETELRELSESYGTIPATVTCAECFTGSDDGPCFDDLPEAAA